jgi:hypothetical protein
MKIAIEKLKSSGKNPRKITKAAIERLKKSILENPDFFEARPILVNHVGDDYVIIGGHQRLEAAKQLGMKEVPIFAFENLSDDQFDKYMLLDNVNEGKWDVDLLLNFSPELLNCFDFNFDLIAKKSELEETTDAFIKNMFYEPSGLETNLTDCIDTSRADVLRCEIDNLDISEEKKEIYKRLADRLVVCNFSLLAEYYANCNNLIEAELIERLSLVIPSVPTALKHNLVKLSAEFYKQYKEKK